MTHRAKNNNKTSPPQKYSACIRSNGMRNRRNSQKRLCTVNLRDIKSTNGAEVLLRLLLLFFAPTNAVAYPIASETLFLIKHRTFHLYYLTFIFNFIFQHLFFIKLNIEAILFFFFLFFLYKKNYKYESSNNYR